jgi:hypothetical protein
MKNVFAHYFSWFSRKDVSGVWEHWNWEGPGTCHNPENIIDGHEDVAAVDIPLIGAYDSCDPRVHEYHLNLATAAGIDAFCVDWYGISGENKENRDNIVDRNFSIMLQRASMHQVKLCICYEEKILFGEKTEEQIIETGRNHMKYISSRYFKSQGYWSVDGRPVLIIWGNNKLSTRVWKEILKEIDEYNPWIIYSHHDHNPEYVELCQGFYPWVLLGDLDFQRFYLEEYYLTVKKYINEGKSHTLGAGVWPGFNDTGVSGWGSGNRIIEDREDKLYALTWEYALKNNPEWISITTWNDWNEGSNIEPGIKKGAKYLKMTAGYINKYKGSNSGVGIDAVLKDALT